jgi:hypothetical protein
LPDTDGASIIDLTFQSTGRSTMGS